MARHVSHQELTRFEVVLNPESASGIYFDAWENEEEPIVIEHVEVMYGDGSVSTENIGEIRLYPRLRAAEDLLVPSQETAEGMRGRSTLVAQKNLAVTGIDYDFASRLGNRLELYWSKGSEVGERDFERPEEERIIGVPLNEVAFPVELQAQEHATIRYRFNDRTAQDWTEVYRLLPQVHAETAEGKVDIRPMSVDYVPYPDEDEVRQFVEEGRNDR